MSIEATDLEYNGWLTAMLMLFIFPMIVFLILKANNSEMEWKRSIAFYIGWIPANIVSCWYLHYSIGIGDAFMIFVFCQIVQVFFIYTLANFFIRMFGERAFP
jgi:hypothetical protein